MQGVVLRVVWPTVAASDCGKLAAAATRLEPPVAQVLGVEHDFGMAGPSLARRDAGGDPIAGQDPLWPELALVLGGRTPYWPLLLRDPGAMRRWRPGDPPVAVTAATAGPDPVPALRLAAAIPADQTAHRVLAEFAGSIQRAAGEEAGIEIELATGDPERARWVELAATNLEVPDLGDLDEVVRRDGWLAITARPDPLAHQVVEQVLRTDHRRWLPFTTAAFVDPSRGRGAEWAGRLQPTRPSAGFEILLRRLRADEQDAITGYLIDPATDAPVIELASGLLWAGVPHRLPVTRPLAELILDTPIWIRLDDASLHLAPHRDGVGISWGYRGGGTSSLALLLTGILDDITTPAAEHVSGGDVGLEELLQNTPPDTTTVLTRAELDAARGRGT